LVRIKSSTTLGAGITISFEPSDDLLALVAALRTGNLDSFFLEHGETILTLLLYQKGTVLVNPQRLDDHRGRRCCFRAIGEPPHEDDGVFGFDERSDFAEFHAATLFGKMSIPHPRSQGRI
jgi:hypothetical protein